MIGFLRCLPFACLLAVPAAAEEGSFNVSLAGVRAGILAYSGEESGGRYTARGSARASGLAGVVLDVTLDTVAQGRVRGNSYRPASYRQVGTERGKSRDMSFRYRGGVPSVTRNPPRTLPDYVANPAAQGGTLDPTTTAYAMLRDRPRDLMCQLDIDLFDGRRRAEIKYVGLRQGRDGTLICEGEYRRLQGFKPEELAEKPFWPFTVTYSPLGGGNFRVTEVRIPTTFGAMRMRRR
ncbi:MAG: DUF3108 domain-containing protein [Rhodobacteraceae bacterium]|nr:DUF3108 domain-containing protein [Paracoccaceae bacterium]